MEDTNSDAVKEAERLVMARMPEETIRYGICWGCTAAYSVEFLRVVSIVCVNPETGMPISTRRVYVCRECKDRLAKGESIPYMSE